MTQTPLSSKHSLAITAVLGLLSVFPPLATDMYLAALGDVAKAMDASHAAAELSLSLFFLGLCIGQLIMGPMIDAYGRKTPLLIGTSLFAVASVALMFVDNIVVFNGLRMVQALGACAGMVVGRAIVRDLYQGRQAAKVMTALVMLLTLGPIVSPTLGSIVHLYFGWRAIFLVMALVGVVALLLSGVVIPETLPAEKRAKAPFAAAWQTTRTMFARKEFVTLVLIAGLIQGGMFAFITGSSGVFQGTFGLSSVSYGLLFAAIAAALLIFGQINNLLLNRFSSEQILSAGLPVYAVMAGLVLLMSGTTHLWLFVLPLWFSVGMVGLLSANAMTLTMASVPSGAGMGSALLGAVQFSLAFAVSSLVALGGTGTPLPMALGLFVPAVIALVLSMTFGRHAYHAVPDHV